MKRRKYWKSGAILLQTLVMSVLLSMMSVMIMKWVLARYIIVNRVRSSNVNTCNALGYAATWGLAANNTKFSTWATGAPGNQSWTIINGTEQKSVSFTQTTAGVFKTTVDDGHSY